MTSFFSFNFKNLQQGQLKIHAPYTRSGKSKMYLDKLTKKIETVGKNYSIQNRCQGMPE